MHPPRTLGSLFSGIGGLERGVEWATGARTVFQVEKEPFCRDVLAKHWPDAVRHDDVCAAGGIPYRIVLPAVDALVGGSPCQGVSVAGLREGFEDERSGLWREYRRIVAYLRPRFVFLENVPGLASSQGGWDFGEVLGGLADLGYDATWDRFRASDVGAPHRRERVFLLGWLVDANCGGCEEVRAVRRELGEATGGRCDPWRPETIHSAHGGEAGVADADGRGGEGSDPRGERAGWDATVAGGAGRVVNAEDERRRPGRLPIGAGEAESLAGVAGTHGLADAHGLWQRQPQGRFADAGGWTRDGGAGGLGHADSERRQECDGPPLAVGQKFRGRGGASGCVEDRPALADVGCDADGLSSGLVRHDAHAGRGEGLDAHRWPVGRGQPQAPWEPPRTASSVTNRPAQLRAYGNAVVPQVAALAWQELFARACAASEAG